MREVMEEKDLELIKELMANNEELAQLWQKHQELEKRLDELSNQVYLTSEEQVERKQLQKVKLSGRDRMDAILAEHRKLKAS